MRRFAEASTLSLLTLVRQNKCVYIDTLQRRDSRGGDLMKYSP